TGRHTNPYCYHTHIETDPHSAARHVSMECIVLWTVKLQEVSYPWGGQAWWFTQGYSSSRKVNTQTHTHSDTHTYTHNHTHTHTKTHAYALLSVLTSHHTTLLTTQICKHTHTHTHTPILR